MAHAQRSGRIGAMSWNCNGGARVALRAARTGAMGLALVLAAMSGAQAQSGETPSAQAGTQAWAATVTYVVDGDSIWVRSVDRGARVKLRLLGIDAPEVCQPLGPEARQALQRMALNQRVRVAVRGRDRYGRALASVVRAQDGADLAQTMVRAGWAWADAFSWHRAAYAAEETSARDARRGVFAQATAERPSDFRRRHGPCVPAKR